MEPELTKEELTEQYAVAILRKQLAEAERDEVKAKNELKSYAASTAPINNSPIPINNLATLSVDPEVQKASNAKAIAESEKDAILARRKVFEGPSVTAPTGEVKVEGAFIETRVLARQTLATTLNTFIVGFCKDLKKKEKRLIVESLNKEIEDKKRQLSHNSEKVLVEFMKEQLNVNKEEKIDKGKLIDILDELTNNHQNKLLNTSENDQLLDELIKKLLEKRINESTDNLLDEVINYDLGEGEKKQLKERIKKMLETKIENIITLIVLNSADIPALELYASTCKQLSLLKEEYKKIVATANELIGPTFVDPSMNSAAFDPLLIGTAINGVVSSAASLFALFRTNTTFSNADIAIDTALLIATFTQVVHKQYPSWEVFAPVIFPIDIINNSTDQTAPSSAFGLLQDLAKVHSDAQTTIKSLESGLSQELVKLVANPENVEIKKSIDQYTTHISKVKSLGDIYGQLYSSLISTSGTIQSLIRAEKVTAKLNKENVYLVALSAASKGSTRIKNNLWSSGSVCFSAGTELSYLVIAANGEITFAGSTCDYTPYIKSKDIRGKLDT